MLNSSGKTVILQCPIAVLGYAATVGPKESQGPLSGYFDIKSEDEFFGEDSFEKAESRLQQLTVKELFKKTGASPDEVDVIFAGDLLNQCIGSAYGLRDFGIPFAGLYGACSTMALGLIMALTSVTAGAASKAIAVTSSHFCSSERQFRFPLEYGGQRPPTAQWTVTGSGALMVGKCDGTASKVTAKGFKIGKIVDLEVTDMNNMGAAMAPAAADTILGFLKESSTTVSDYDLILTGDLGFTGSELLKRLCLARGVDLFNHNDCGKMIFDREAQDVHSGGSGCGCSASVLCSYVLQKMSAGELKNVLFCATGALMSPTSSMQGESIPSIAHLIHLSAD